MANWFVKLQGFEIGPISDPELRELVVQDKLSAHEPVRREDQSEWITAGAVEGLFAPEAIPAPTIPDPPLDAVPAPAPQQPSMRSRPDRLNPLIVRCTRPGCRRYMLVAKADLGTKVRCMSCREPFVPAAGRDAQAEPPLEDQQRNAS